ncbi:MAG TPA: depupylase/deamidase Dop [Actinomycetaceae bacterium]|nr:depupylase/deamidase Dop [Actinomycetaceae bacterium]
MRPGRVMGIETEYGVITPGRPEANPVAMSTVIVRAYAAGVPSAPWDYAGEDPLNDARGFRMGPADADPSQLTDDPDAAAPAGPVDLHEVGRTILRGGPANAVLPNGARLYVDHAHPEYSSPEVVSALDAVTWDRAGDEIMREAMATLRRAGGEIVVYKNNVDGKGASYGTHENYLVERSVPFGEIASYLTPFFVTRPLFAGSGRVGLGQRSGEPGFQISQRADYIENDIGLETTFNRPIINTRDEPHADPERFRRLHVIIGDANTFDVPNFLKFATTDLVLGLIEAGEVPLELDAITLTAPVVDVRGVSREPFGHVLSTQGSSAMRALDIQRAYLDLVDAHFTRTGRHGEVAETLALWDHVLDGLADDPESVADCVEWVAKRQLLEGMRERSRSGWNDPRLAALDLQWSDLRPERSVVSRLDAAGRVRRLVSPQEVARAVGTPPANTRAWLRGELIRRFPDGVAAAGWSSIVLDSPRRGRLLRIPLTDPRSATEERAGNLVKNNGTIDELLDALGGRERH